MPEMIFEHHVDGLPAAIMPEPPDERGRLSVWMDGHTYRVDPEVLKPLTATYSPDQSDRIASEPNNEETP